MSVEERLTHLEKHVKTLERDLREHWHDISAPMHEPKKNRTSQVLLPQYAGKDR
jgi:hypothetical protein